MLEIVTKEPNKVAKMEKYAYLKKIKETLGKMYIIAECKKPLLDDPEDCP